FIHRAYRSNTLKHKTFYESMLPLISPVLLFILSTLWIFASPNQILEGHPRLFYFMVGTTFANITCQLIVCQMSNTRCQPLSWLLFPLALVVLVVVSGFGSEIEALLLVLMTALVTFAHLHYGIRVVDQLSKHFNILPFSLQKPNTD
ncbi:ethanolaminephosphotransferase 1, partial [Pseudophryne corroboree]|uniref:ethanolaminephosphotransferase 1 n=1 Tax=Pseudophryne corroboree TaxID=495146 RepID=UPI0030813946